jgi:8-oxo-dGTP pyrophosphatase MutT (NUDIX family)
MKKKIHKEESDGKESIRVVAGGIIVDDEGKIFLAKGKKFGGKWIVPGGGVKWGESLEDGAKREILEETGMEVVVEGKLGFSDFIWIYFYSIINDSSSKRTSSSSHASISCSESITSFSRISSTVPSSTITRVCSAGTG